MQDAAYYFSQLEKELLFHCVSGKSLACEQRSVRQAALSFFHIGATCKKLNARISECWKEILNLIIRQRSLSPSLFDLKFHWTNPCSSLVLNWIDGTPNFTKMNVSPSLCKVGFVINPSQKLEIFGLDEEHQLWAEVDRFDESTVELGHTLILERDSQLAPPLYECRGSFLFVSNGFSGIDIFDIKTKALLGSLKDKGNHFLFNNSIKPLIYENYVFVLFWDEKGHYMLNAYVDSEWEKPLTWRVPFSGINKMDSNQSGILFSYRSHQGYQLASISYTALLKCSKELTESVFCYSEQLSYEVSLAKVGEEFVGCHVQEHVMKIQKICLKSNKNILTEVHIEGLDTHKFNNICDVCSIYDKIFILGKLENASCGAILSIDLTSMHIDKVEFFHDLYVKVKAISSLLGRLHILFSQSGLKNSFILTLDYTK